MTAIPEQADSLSPRQRRKALRRLRNEPPVRSLLEEIGNSVSHGAGALLSVAGMIILLVKARTVSARAAAVIYGSCLILLFLMSCLYHAFPRGSGVKRLWRRFDYSSIYLLIGGTFTPMWLVSIRGTTGLVLCCAQWLVIIAGITLIAVFGPGSLRPMHQTLYMVLGWTGLVFLPRLWRGNTGFFWTLLAGGVLYTLGVIPFARKTKGAHFLWHLFVLGGAAVQWAGICRYLY